MSNRQVYDIDQPRPESFARPPRRDVVWIGGDPEFSQAVGSRQREEEAGAPLGKVFPSCRWINAVPDMAHVTLKILGLADSERNRAGNFHRGAAAQSHPERVGRHATQKGIGVLSASGIPIDKANQIVSREVRRRISDAGRRTESKQVRFDPADCRLDKLQIVIDQSAGLQELEPGRFAGLAEPKAHRARIIREVWKGKGVSSSPTGRHGGWIVGSTTLPQKPSFRLTSGPAELATPGAFG